MRIRVCTTTLGLLAAIPAQLPSYVSPPPESMTYTADPAFLSDRNGWLASRQQQPSSDPARLDCGGFYPVMEGMAATLGQWAGAGPDNHALTNGTVFGGPGVGNTVRRTATPISVPANRFLTLSGTTHPRRPARRRSPSTAASPWSTRSPHRERGAKAGWSFTDALPADLVANSTTTTCAGTTADITPTGLSSAGDLSDQVSDVDDPGLSRPWTITPGANVDPGTANGDLFVRGTPVTCTALFTDIGTHDTHTCTVDLVDGCRCRTAPSPRHPVRGRTS